MDDARALAGRRWHIGSMNDGLFIIDRRPSPSNDHPVHEYRAGISPDLVLPLEGAASQRAIERAQAIVDAHNAAIDRLAAPEGVGLTRYELWGSIDETVEAEEDPTGEWVRHEDAAAALAAEKARADEAEERIARHRQSAMERQHRIEAERDALKAALERVNVIATDYTRSPHASLVDIAALSKTQGGG